MPAEMQIYNPEHTKPDVTLRHIISEVDKQWRQALEEALGDRPNLNRDITLTLACEGLRTPLVGKTTLYGALFLSFHQCEHGDWECGPFECLDSIGAGELHISGGEMGLSIDALQALQDHFGVVDPETPEYLHRSGPLFDNMLSAFKKEVRFMHRHRHHCEWEIDEAELDRQCRHTLMCLLISPAMGSGLDLI